MEYRLAADLIVLIHLAFILFVMGGAVLALRWRWVAAVHLPAAVWGALVEFTGWICPLTPLESRLREAGGAVGYSGGFVEHCLLPIVYPVGLTREVQLALGLLVLVVNAAAYALILRHRRRERGPNRR
ncbi:MAG: DUF2784 domain-containing protein [Gammaproteobacteria bacterium]